MAPADAADVLKLHLHRRRQAGAKADDLVFVCKTVRARKNGWIGYIDANLGVEWRRVRKALGLGEMTWYQASRHSFVSRNLKNGVSLDEVSAAVGHSSPIVTKRFYAHYVRKEFSAEMRRGLAS